MAKEELTNYDIQAELLQAKLQLLKRISAGDLKPESLERLARAYALLSGDRKGGTIL